MPRPISPELKGFLNSFSSEIQALTLELRDYVWGVCPEANELLYDNYNALVIGFSVSEHTADAFFSLAVYARHINFGFLRGSEIPDPENRLTGGGNLYRYLTLRSLHELPKAYVEPMLRQALDLARLKMKPGRVLTSGLTLVKSQVEKKRRG